MATDTPRPVPGYAPGELWSTFDASPRGREITAAAYGALITGADPMPFNTSHAMAAAYDDAEPCRPWGSPGMWELPPRAPAPPSDEEVMRPIVEAAMRSIGMSVPLRPIIPTIMRGRRHDGR